MKSAARAIAFAAMVGTLCASSVLAEDAAKAPVPANTSQAMRVIVDPETGEVRAPTQDELEGLIQAERAARAAEQSSRAGARAAAPAARTDIMPEEKSVVRHANGMVSVRMSQDSLSLIKIERDASGKARLVHANEAASTLPVEEK